jgi:metal-responsive CopG/Arc/MetJ family transcriptional regulator
MPKVSKIAISLPEEVLQAVEKQREDSGESRSQFFRRAVEMLIRSKREQERSERYIRAYQEIPETSDEVSAVRHAASVILKEEPWK